MPKGRRGWGRRQRIGIRGGGSARVGKGGSHPSDRDQRPEHALPSELLTPAEKCQKIYCFPEECLLKLQTPMPQNMKEKRKRNLTSFSENWDFTLGLVEIPQLGPELLELGERGSCILLDHLQSFHPNLRFRYSLVESE
jgi:hypothetical protein